MKFPKGIEGDYLETKQNYLIFDVKGLLHPKNRKICFIRFYPDTNGERRRNNILYKKIYNIEERYSFLRENYPQYLFHSNQYDLELQGVRAKEIKKIYSPRDHLKKIISKKELNEINSISLKLCYFLMKEGNFDVNNIGISGSPMVGLNKNDSDIDLIIYGTEISHIIQDTLKNLYDSKKNNIRRYNLEEFKKHFQFRAGGSGISFDEFLRSEKYKLHQGKFNGKDFFIRYLKSPKDWVGSYYDFRFKNNGRIQLKAKILDSTDSIFTPCTYKIKTLKIEYFRSPLNEIKPNEITQINSYRGRFCEHAKKNDLVFVEGKLEKTIYKDSKIFYRVLLGNLKNDKMIKLTK
ncbi:MAG: hypothetical protein EU550_03990 [Promethearchaeota archaeon]|nr:MAG: hypothetical protein EU550_03990 [Candidatus Lokiarchaeota archaeon]